MSEKGVTVGKRVGQLTLELSKKKNQVVLREKGVTVDEEG
jgi:hypothetical protein